MGRELAAGWSPFLYGVRGPEGLYRLWAVTLSATLGRPVRAAEVALAIHATDHVDAGLEPAVNRWRAIPPPLRFCPPGIRRQYMDESDIRMWLKVGAILEREIPTPTVGDLFDIPGGR